MEVLFIAALDAVFANVVAMVIIGKFLHRQFFFRHLGNVAEQMGCKCYLRVLSDRFHLYFKPAQP